MAAMYLYVWGQTPRMGAWVTPPGATVTSPVRLIIEEDNA
jgi:hypothetical protein